MTKQSFEYYVEAIENNEINKLQIFLLTDMDKLINQRIAEMMSKKKVKENKKTSKTTAADTKENKKTSEKDKKIFSKDLMQNIFSKYYLTDDSYFKTALDSLKKDEAKTMILEILSYEDENFKLDEKYNVILPDNFQVIADYDKINFNGEILSNYIEGSEEYLEREEMELYDDPADFEGGYYFDGDPDDDEEGLADMTLEEWVEEQTGYLRYFIDALKDFK